MTEAHEEETPNRKARAIPREDRVAIVLLLVFTAVTGCALARCGSTPEEPQAVRSSPSSQASQAATDVPVREQPEQNEAADQSSPRSAIEEARLVSAHIAQVKSMRSELNETMDALSKKAKSSTSASRRWDRIWAERRRRYTQRVATVRAHNSSERRRYAASETERANSAGKLVIVHTYTPRYWAYPSRPNKPRPLKGSVASQVKRLSRLQEQIDALESTIASESTTARSFEPVYGPLSTATQALAATVDDATRLVRTVVVKRGAKGSVIDASKLSKVNLGVLDAPMVALDGSYSDALAAAGLSAGQVATGAANVP